VGAGVAVAVAAVAAVAVAVISVATGGAEAIVAVGVGSSRQLANAKANKRSIECSSQRRAGVPRMICAIILPPQ